MEHVTTVKGAQRLDIRLRELQRRSGRGGGLAPLTVFDILVAARGRGEKIATVIRHQCRHDEGIRDCSTAPIVEV